MGVFSHSDACNYRLLCTGNLKLINNKPSGFTKSYVKDSFVVGAVFFKTTKNKS